MLMACEALELPDMRPTLAQDATTGQPAHDATDTAVLAMLDHLPATASR